MVCEMITIATISDLLVYPTGCDYYFYLKIFFAIFLVLVWTLYKVEKSVNPQTADLISSLGVSSIAIIILGLIGTLIKSAENIPMIQTDILLYILAVSIPIILIWIFKD